MSISGMLDGETRMRRSILCIAVNILLLVVTYVMVEQAEAMPIYFSSASGLQRANSDGTGLQTFLPGPEIRGLAVDAAAGFVYFSDSVSLWRTDLDGMGATVLRTFDMRDIELDFTSKKIYIGRDHQIYRMDFDGSNLEFITQIGNSLTNLGLDLVSNKLYYTDGGDGNRILRSDLDGANPETLIQFAVNVDLDDIAVDPLAGKMYWTDQLTNKVQRANLDGSNIEDLVDDFGRRLALDLDTGKIYWTSPVFEGIRRANLDGSNIELVLSSINSPFALDLGSSAVHPPAPVPVPEPSTLILMGFGLAGLFVFNRKRKQNCHNEI